MASFGGLTNLQINGSDSYTGPGPVSLTWKAATASGSFEMGPYLTAEIDDGDSWGEAGYPDVSPWNATSYTLTPANITHVANSPNKRASITIKVWGYDESWNSISRRSNTVTFNYANVTACGAPTSVTVAANNVRPGTGVTLNWSGAAGGTGNAITGYDIYRSTEAGSGYTLLTSVTSTATSGSTVVTSHETKGASYYYKVVTKGAAGASYYSGQSTATATLTTAPYGNTIGYYQGGNFAMCEVYYFDGSAFVECIPYYRRDGDWVECHSG